MAYVFSEKYGSLPSIVITVGVLTPMVQVGSDYQVGSGVYCPLAKSDGSSKLTRTVRTFSII